MIDKLEEFCLKILEKIHLKKLADWYRKHKEGMRYLIFGALTTIVNIIAYAVLYYLFHISNAVSNILAWIIGATFAYITNKLYVFNSKVNTKKELLKELVYFYGCRLLTLAIDEGIMIVAVDKLGWNALLMKIIANIIVIILNFVFSKILIFKKQDKKV
ncbi:MAG: GtrA family protein [Clostridia bacterium]|nr:GtrA family protein [Clostridia bacterium]